MTTIRIYRVLFFLSTLLPCQSWLLGQRPDVTDESWRFSPFEFIVSDKCLTVPNVLDDLWLVHLSGLLPNNHEAYSTHRFRSNDLMLYADVDRAFSANELNEADGGGLPAGFQTGLSLLALIGWAVLVPVLIWWRHRFQREKRETQGRLASQQSELDRIHFELERLETERSAEQLRARLLQDLESSERKLIEEVRRSEEKFRILFNFAGDAIFIHDTEGRILELNQRASEYLGYSREELLNMKFPDFSAREQSILYPKQIEQLREHNSLFFETVHVRKDGTRIPVEINSRILEYEGEPAVLSIARDITERSRAEEEKEELAELLRQAQKMEAIGCLAGGIAHDFNNILQAVLGYTMLAMHKIPSDNDAYGYLEKVEKAGRRAADVVNQILTFSRQTKREQRPIDLQPLLKETLKLLRGSLPTTIEIRRELDPHCGRVMANATQIHQVIMNLCVNAYHAMRERGGVLEVSLTEVNVDSELVAKHSELKRGKHVRLRVRDTGCGMDQATLERIFEPYFTTKGTGEGTGLGLATVHGIVKIHGGAIVADSDVGKGTAFDVFFPVYIQDANITEAQIPDQTPPEGNESILFVDDEELIVQWGEKLLEDLGYRVTACTDSLEALKEFRAHPDRFNVVITDQTMPNMTGVELVRELHQIRPDVPIILCTGFSERVDEQQAKAMGIREYLSKPIIQLDLAKAVRRALGENGIKESPSP
ncbi:MAG: PAS domain S-box protein [bacterium]